MSIHEFILSDFEDNTSWCRSSLDRITSTDLSLKLAAPHYQRTSARARRRAAPHIKINIRRSHTLMITPLLYSSDGQPQKSCPRPANYPYSVFSPSFMHFTTCMLSIVSMTLRRRYPDIIWGIHGMGTMQTESATRESQQVK